jgi:hypothetical protein
MVVPLAFLLMVSALLLLTLGWLPLFGKALALSTVWLADGMNRSVGWIEHLPHAVTYAELSLPAMTGMYLIIFFFIILLKRIVQ